MICLYYRYLAVAGRQLGWALLCQLSDISVLFIYFELSLVQQDYSNQL